MRWLLAPLVLLTGCGTVLTPVVIREPRPEQLPLAIGVHYPDELRSFSKVRLRDRYGGTADAKMLVGEASVRLFDDALGLLFASVVPLPTVAQVGAADGGPSAVIEPRIASAAQELGTEGPDGVFARTTIVYELALYSDTGQRLATWTVTGAGFASTSTRLRESGTWNVNQRSVELAMRDAAWNFTNGFRDVPEVRRWLDQRGVR